ncbi:MAG TPA: helix-turn-helix domain-containing protein [Myxococcota bacterium]
MLTDAPADPSRRARKKLALRGRVLEAATALFSERGFAETKVADICERADVAQKTLFNYFATKQDLLREIAVLALDELLVDVETARKQHGTTAARLAHFFAQMAARVEQGGAMHRELVTELVHTVHGMAEKSDHARRLHAAFDALVREGLAAGELTRRHAPETLTQMILGTYYVLIFDFANLEDHPIRAHADAASRFLADALAARPGE